MIRELDNYYPIDGDALRDRNLPDGTDPMEVLRDLPGAVETSFGTLYLPEDVVFSDIGIILWTQEQQAISMYAVKGAELLDSVETKQEEHDTIEENQQIGEDKMSLTNKFLVFDLEKGSFVGENQNDVRGLDLTDAAIHSERSFDLTEKGKSYLQIPLTQEMVDAFPFSLKDMDPEMPHSKDMPVSLDGDFVVLTEYGFYDEKYNSLTNTSRPQIRSFQLDYANLYNQEVLEKLGTDYILSAEEDDPKPIAVPISKEQQDLLAKLPEFSPKKEPHGFFMEPIGDSQKVETDMDKATGADLGDALDQLAEETKSEGIELPWN